MIAHREREGPRSISTENKPSPMGMYHQPSSPHHHSRRPTPISTSGGTMMNEQSEDEALNGNGSDNNSSVNVIVRVRPLLKTLEGKSSTCVHVLNANPTMTSPYNNNNNTTSPRSYQSSKFHSPNHDDMNSDNNSGIPQAYSGSEDTTADLTASESNISSSQTSTSPSSYAHQNRPSSHHHHSLKTFQTVQVGDSNKSPAFRFDHVYPQQSNQAQVYSTSVTPLVQSCLNGYNATVIAYGQTGSGKYLFYLLIHFYMRKTI